MNDILLNNPETSYHITSDKDAELLLHELGMINKFIPNPNPDQSWFSSITNVQGHPTHYIIAFRFSGFPSPANNGYIVDCLPKSEYSLAEIQANLNIMAVILDSPNLQGNFVTIQAGSN